MKIIADISGNHGGYLEKAVELIYTAAECGCHYAKFQYYTPREMYANEPSKALYEQLHVPFEWLDSLFGAATRTGIGLFASVFSADAVGDLLPYDPDYYKIASPKSTWLPKSTYAAIAKAVPADRGLLISACGRDMHDMWHHTGLFKGARNFLYCPVGHPQHIGDADIDEFYKRGFYGFSDHTPGLIAPLALAAAGANMIEKHLKLDDDCIDAHFSADARTMATLVEHLDQ